MKETLETEQVYEGKREVQLGWCSPMWYISFSVQYSAPYVKTGQRHKEKRKIEFKRETFKPLLFFLPLFPGFLLVYSQLSIAEFMRPYWCGGYIREVATHWKYNENSVEEEKQQGASVVC